MESKLVRLHRACSWPYSTSISYNGYKFLQTVKDVQALMSQCSGVKHTAERKEDFSLGSSTTM